MDYRGQVIGRFGKSMTCPPDLLGIPLRVEHVMAEPEGSPAEGHRHQSPVAHLRLRDDAHRQDSELPQPRLQGQLSLSRQQINLVMGSGTWVWVPVPQR